MFAHTIEQFQPSGKAAQFESEGTTFGHVRLVMDSQTGVSFVSKPIALFYVSPLTRPDQIDWAKAQRKLSERVEFIVGQGTAQLRALGQDPHLIAPVQYSLAMQEGMVYADMIYPYLNCVTLRELLTDPNKLTKVNFSRFLRHIALALDTLKLQLNVAHLDVHKPDNTLFDLDSHQFYLTDFGLSSMYPPAAFFNLDDYVGFISLIKLFADALFSNQQAEHSRLLELLDRFKQEYTGQYNQIEYTELQEMPRFSALANAVIHMTEIYE